MILAYGDHALERAASALRAGELVAFPTETVYGLGARADRSDAVRRIYAKKGRPLENPSIVHVLDQERAFALAASVPEAARRLAEAFWPGPLTLVLPVREGVVAPEVTAGGPTVAVRVPVHPVARALLEAAALPVAAPSANRSTSISPTTAAHVEKSLGADLLVLDGGTTGFGIESTIVDVSRAPAVLLRRGSIRLSALAALVDVVDRGDAIAAAGAPMPAPGGQARHYAPSVPLTVLDRADLESASRGASAGAELGLVVRGSAPHGPHLVVEALPPDAAGYEQGLYAALHRLEDAGVAAILVERVPDGEAFAAVRDRLARAGR